MRCFSASAKSQTLNSLAQSNYAAQLPSLLRNLLDWEFLVDMPHERTPVQLDPFTPPPLPKGQEGLLTAANPLTAREPHP